MENFNSWDNLTIFLKKNFGIDENLQSILFLIGLQESGKGFKAYDQEEKTEIIKLAQIKLLARENFYIPINVGNSNESGWIENPNMSIPGELVLEKLLKSLILDYFNKQQFSN
jgi:hypothetical protein